MNGLTGGIQSAPNQSGAPFAKGGGEMPMGLIPNASHVTKRSPPMPSSVLIIDDDSTVLHVFKTVFETTDTILHTASTASEGMQMLARHQVDAVLLDVMLPDAEGLDVFDRIQRHDA